MEILFYIIGSIIAFVIIWALILEHLKIKAKKQTEVSPDLKPLPEQVNKQKAALFVKRDCELLSFEIIKSKDDPVFVCMSNDPIIILRDNKTRCKTNRLPVDGNVKYYDNVNYSSANYNGTFAPPPNGYRKTYRLRGKNGFSYQYKKI